MGYRQLMESRRLRAPDDGGAGGAGDDGNTDDGKTGGEGGQGGGEGGGSLLDHAKKAGGDGDDGGEGGGTGDDGGPGLARDDEGGDKAHLLTERPDYIPERMWPKDVGDGVDPAAMLEKVAGSYKELEAKFKRGDHKAPDSADGYKVEVPDDLKVFIDDKAEGGDPVVNALLGVAAERGFSNDDVNAIMETVLGSALELVGPPVNAEAFAKEQIAKLGKGGQALIDGLDGWAQSLKNQGILDDSQLAAMRNMARTAEEVQALAILRELSGEQAIPMDHVVGDEVPSEEELYSMTADPKYGTDKAFTAKVDEWFEQRFGTQAAGTSRSGLGA